MASLPGQIFGSLPGFLKAVAGSHDSVGSYDVGVKLVQLFPSRVIFI